jgi:hypothetical protein
MIDPLRPYWPTNRSIAGFVARSLCLLIAAAAVTFDPSGSFVGLIVVASALAQAALLVFEWMELKRTHRSGLTTAGVIAVLFLSLLFVLLIEGRSVLVLSVR